jgi:dihydropteroate synthase
VDTYKAEVAAAACRAGATLVNDVSGLTLDPELAAATAEAGAALVLGHIRGTPRTMQANVVYADVLADVADFLAGAVARAMAAGVPRARILVDPGIGFGKSVAGNLTLIRGAGALRERLGLPVLLGPSRKSFIGQLTGAPVEDRLPGTLAALVAGRLFGADVLRVHDVREAHQAAVIADALAGLDGAPRRAAS